MNYIQAAIKDVKNTMNNFKRKFIYSGKLHREMVGKLMVVTGLVYDSEMPEEKKHMYVRNLNRSYAKALGIV